MAHKANKSLHKLQKTASRLGGFQFPTMSCEELKIRGELEIDVEREIEEEIKDGICRLALRLHRLYQQQKERNAARDPLPDLGKKDKQGTKNQVLSEVNVNIKMEGGTRIEIKEIKKDARENRTRIPKTGNTKGMVPPPNPKKFDWVKSLRSGTNSLSVPLDNKMDSSRQSKLHIGRAKTGLNASQQHKVSMELGWKD